MYKFEFNLTLNEALELFYEYVISECENYFNVPNVDITFKIFWDEEKRNMFIAVYKDGAKGYIDDLNIDDLQYTANKCESIKIDDFLTDEINIVNNKICLMNNEIRYIKFSMQTLIEEISKMFYKMSNMFFNIEKHCAKISFDSLNGKFYYLGETPKYNKIWKKEKTEIIDISDKMKEYYV